MVWLEDGQGIIQGGKSIRLDSRRVPEPLDTGGDVTCQNPASNCPGKNSLVGLSVRSRGFAPQPGQRVSGWKIGADKLGAGRLNVVILCHGNPSSGTSLLHRRDNLAFVVRDKAGVSKQVP